MDEGEIVALTAWIAQAGLAGESEQKILKRVCHQLRRAGVRLSRANLIVDTLHPTREGHIFRWRCDEGLVAPESYGRGEYDAESWSRSPFYFLINSELRSLRRHLTSESELEFAVLPGLRAEGFTEYLAIVDRFGKNDAFGEMECVYSSWVTDAAAGFSDEEVATIERLSPFLALAVKCRSLATIAETLVSTYLGRDAGRRVLAGRIVRGQADRIDAVLWFSDLQGYTRISDTAEPEQIIPLLNDYADAIVTAIHEQGGDVLKFMGDGVLAVFTAAAVAPSCEAALAAARAARARIAALNERRSAQGLPATDIYLGLHLGSAFYGNIGSSDRLDFTVVGPAVNEVSRIAAMCRSVDQTVLLSASFAATLDPERSRFVSVGRFALKGVGRPQELFTFDADGV